MFTVLIYLLVIVLVVVAIFRTVVIVPQATTVLVQRFGRYHVTLKSGLHFILPLIDGIRARVDMREIPLELKPMPVITRDNATLTIDTVVFLQVTDPERAVYEVTDYILAIERLVQTTLRDVVGGLDLDGTLTSRETINASLQKHLDEATDKWGTKVTRIEVRSITPPEDIRQAMERQMLAERNRRAAVTEAEGKKNAAILEAEGTKQAIILTAEAQRERARVEADGQAQAILTVRQAQAQGLRLVSEAGLPPQLAQALATFQDSLGDKDKIVLLPTEISGLAGAAGLFQALLEK